MILSGINKILARGTYIKLIMFTLILQLISLVRNYPLNHPCGRVLELTKGVRVLINCDSAVYMKDAQSPSRLFNGESVYQDRPLPTFIVAMVAKAWHLLGLPDYYRNIVGNSGLVVTYSLVTYVLFLILSTNILSISCWLGIKTFSNISNRFDIDNEYFTFIAFAFTVLISMNEITKTFFWTPGSQMFNILIPIYLFYLLQFAHTPVSMKFFMLNTFLFMILLFSYAFFILLIIPLVLLGWKNYKIRIIILTVVISIYASYPMLLRLAGGTYNNFALGYRRLYLWIFDAYLNHEFLNKIEQYLTLFMKTFPIVPTILGVITIVLFVYKYSVKVVKLEFLTLFFYSMTLAFYGYYSRRLTYPIIIFFFLMMFKMYISNPKKVAPVEFSLASSLFILVVLYSWLYTNGPLI